MRFSSISTVLLGLIGSVSAFGGIAPDSRQFRTLERHGLTVFKHAATDSKLEYVTNSGICETTPGVGQYSGYLSVGKNHSMWFWFFEARHNAEKAPLAIWLNGGPGCSSMIGLFTEHGPCHFVNNDTEPSLNPHSWNEYANMLYIDQPIGTGFSVGTEDVNSTAQAAPYIWKFMQVFLDRFPKYKSREFGLFTQSYGGHYGPEFADYFLKKNDQIKKGDAEGHKVDMVALGINNGWIDPKRQFKSYATYANRNPYKQILNNKLFTRFIDAYNKYCLPVINNCTQLEGQDDECAEADDACNTQMYTNLEIAGRTDFNVYDVRIGRDDVDPPETFLEYLTRAEVMDAIGANTRFAECSDTVYANMATTGDGARSYIGPLADVVKRGINTLLWAGDTDWICNWEGVLWASYALEWPGQKKFVAAPFSNYTINGTAHGRYKTVENLSFLKVWEAGHSVPYYREYLRHHPRIPADKRTEPETALQVFKQVMQKKPIKGT
ncbi:Carboxypeptidase S1 [Fusarium proliferatum]|uniref:Carboxypeptidase S1 n=1 Tax=Gibberella intermedia TaxID=948311 RepID=A0A420TVW6_GIBIN|nr:Carboxypeptidase S1 [Fusarium proliferatum]